MNPDRGAAAHGTLYWWRASVRGCWRPALAVALVGGLLGAVALAAVAGARRTSSAYGRYLASVNASDVLVSTPGRVPGVPVTRLIRQISQLPGVASGAAFVGLNAEPVFHGRADDSYLTSGLNGSFGSLREGGEFFAQDRMTVLAGRLPPPGSASEIVLTPGLARTFGTGVGGTVSYAFRGADDAGRPAGKLFTRTYRVAAIADIPPVLVDDSDQVEAGVLPAAAAGIPLGIAAGRWAWRSFAGSLGVVPVTVVPVLLLAAGAAALIAAGNLLALAPAALAARTPPGATLRAE